MTVFSSLTKIERTLASSSFFFLLSLFFFFFHFSAFSFTLRSPRSPFIVSPSQCWPWLCHSWMDTRLQWWFATEIPHQVKEPRNDVRWTRVFFFFLSLKELYLTNCFGWQVLLGSVCQFPVCGCLPSQWDNLYCYWSAACHHLQLLCQCP